MDSAMMVWAFVTSHIAEILQVVGMFAVMARWTPNTTDDRMVQFLLDGINFLGFNHGNAKNAD